MAYTVKSVAALAGITVRALHHYDHIGLFRPALVSSAGYRLYSKADLQRLQEILFFRELGFALAEIKAIVHGPRYKRDDAIREHRKLLLEKRRRLDKLIELVDRTIDESRGGMGMNDSEMFAGFDRKQVDDWTNEARKRWGHKNVDESLRRTAHYTNDDWQSLFEETGTLTKVIADNMDSGAANPLVQAEVAKWHQIINDRFYECSPAMFRVLGDLYIDDARFTATYEKIRPGLARFMREAMHIYADELDGKV